MGGETSRSTMGLQDHQTRPDRRNSVLVAYGTEDIIPVEIDMLTLQVEKVVPDQNGTLLRLMLDHSEERRQQAQIRIATYQQQIRAAHHKKVKV